MAVGPLLCPTSSWRFGCRSFVATGGLYIPIGVWCWSTSSNCSFLRLKVARISCLFAWAPVSTCSGTVPRSCLFEAFVAQLLLFQSDGSSRPIAATEDPTHFESCSQSSSNKSNTGSDSSSCGRLLELVSFARRLEDLLWLDYALASRPAQQFTLCSRSRNCHESLTTRGVREFSPSRCAFRQVVAGDGVWEFVSQSYVCS
ncbi:hypothetical protein K469DRAFT_151571 [Zopfia rhizophila CBS 207.26]|uniref:Uncharacterized protein n=1 Tax=Zopfia rhizophila CBS 207.26 TaxID=1314779 RepID=A0A6A6D629_9PEZI|nr:hypothetical protein K469DRAFT_151571 [Zopfia rhizophila CBS 207.26]